MKPKVILIHRIFAAYRKPIYDKLAEAYDFLLLHGEKDKTIKQAKTDYSKVIKSIQYTSNPTNLLFQSFSDYFRFRPDAVIHESSIGILTLFPMYILCKLMRVKFLLYGHGYNRFNGFDPQKKWADKFRIFLINLADALIIYSQTDKKMFAQYIDSDKIFVAQNTLDNTHLAKIRNNLVLVGKDKIKEKIGFTHQYNLTFIGRILPEKMPEKVLEVFEILQSKMPNKVAIHFIGEGESASLEKDVKSRGWQNQVKFYGAIYDDSISGEYLFASDFMIMPGYLGLAVNHAFMFDCPVISFKQTKSGPFHSPEIEYVVNKETGFLIPDLSVPEMADTIYNYLNNKPLQEYIKKRIRIKMDSELTMENMVKGFTDAVDFALKSKQSFLQSDTTYHSL
jgi:glycosyltransferase involved in cell wall biosynthesis